MTTWFDSTTACRTQRDNTKTDANALECTDLWQSELRNMYVYWPGRGLYCPTDEGTNGFYNNVVDNFFVYSPSICGVYLKPTYTGIL